MDIVFNFMYSHKILFLVQRLDREKLKRVYIQDLKDVIFLLAEPIHSRQFLKMNPAKYNIFLLGLSQVIYYICRIYSLTVISIPGMCNQESS